MVPCDIIIYICTSVIGRIIPVIVLPASADNSGQPVTFTYLPRAESVRKRSVLTLISLNERPLLYPSTNPPPPSPTHPHPLSLSHPPPFSRVLFTYLPRAETEGEKVVGTDMERVRKRAERVRKWAERVRKSEKECRKSEKE